MVCIMWACTVIACVIMFDEFGFIDIYKQWYYICHFIYYTRLLFRQLTESPDRNSMQRQSQELRREFSKLF